MKYNPFLSFITLKACKIVKGPELCTERVSFTDQTSLFYNAQETLLEKRNGLLLINWNILLEISTF